MNTTTNHALQMNEAAAGGTPKLDLGGILIGNRVERNDQGMLATPEKIGARHNPISHIEFVETIEQQLSDIGLELFHTEHALSNEGARYFGLMQVKQRNGNPEDWSTVLGARAAHDQKFAAQLVAGSGVFICSNLMMNGEVKVGTKQTTNMNDRLPELIRGALFEVSALNERTQVRFEKYKATALPEMRANAAITHMVRTGAITPQQMPKVIQEWDTPCHEEFAQDKNVWRLMNAVTEAYKPTGERSTVVQIAQRSPKLQVICDTLADIQLAA